MAATYLFRMPLDSNRLVGVMSRKMSLIATAVITRSSAYFLEVLFTFIISSSYADSRADIFVNFLSLSDVN
jgi:hypothetical protein